MIRNQTITRIITISLVEVRIITEATSVTEEEEIEAGVQVLIIPEDMVEVEEDSEEIYHIRDIISINSVIMKMILSMI